MAIENWGFAANQAAATGSPDTDPMAQVEPGVSPNINVSAYEDTSGPVSSGKFTLGGRTYQVDVPSDTVNEEGASQSANKYETKISEILTDGTTKPVVGNGTSPVSLQMASAIEDKRFADWLSKDDPSTMADDVMRKVWEKDPTGALMLYGQQDARKAGGDDATPDQFAFDDKTYWPAVFGGAHKALSAELLPAVDSLGLNTKDTKVASAKWGNMMSPQAQKMRNDPGGDGLLGGLFNTLDPILDKIDPLHNVTQNFITDIGGFDSQEQAFSTIAPMVLNYFVPGAGSLVSSADAASRGDWGGALISGAAGAYGVANPGGSLAGSIGSKITQGAATDLASKAVGNVILGAAQGAANGNAGKGAIGGLISTGIGQAVNGANAPTDTADKVINGVASSAATKAVMNGIYGNNASGGASLGTNSNTSSAQTSGGTTDTGQSIAAYRPKIEKWGFA